MKKACIGFAVLLALLLAVAAACAETTTLLVYMCGTDLQEDACQDLVEMAEVEAGDSINVDKTLQRRGNAALGIRSVPSKSAGM